MMIRGDHLVGDMYVLFEQKFKEEYAAWQESTAGKAIYEEKKKEKETQSDFFKRYKNDYFNLEKVIWVCRLAKCPKSGKRETLKLKHCGPNSMAGFTMDLQKHLNASGLILINWIMNLIPIY